MKITDVTVHKIHPGPGMKNFIFVKLGIPARTFRDGCAAQNIKVGRDFPPYQNEWARISISTIEDMRRAVNVFDRVLEAGGQKKAPRQGSAA